MNLKLGLKPPTHDDRDLKFAAYLKKALPPHPATFGHLKEMAQVPWQMLGNDQYGDCAYAGSAHETMLWNKLRGVDVPFDTKVVLQCYGEQTGFNPATGEGDNGTDMREQMKYRQKTGILDVNGNRHIIGAYTWLEPGNWNQMLQACWMMDSVAIGFRVPSSVMDQFNSGKKWDVTHHDGPIEGGHYVPGFGLNSAGDLVLVTWGREQAMTRAFYEKYCDQACAIVSLEVMVDGKSPEGFAMDDLISDLSSL